MLPTAHLRVLAVSVQPELADSNVAAAGTPLFNVTPEAVLVAPLVMVAVNVTRLPAVVVAGLAVSLTVSGNAVCVHSATPEAGFVPPASPIRPPAKRPSASWESA